MVKNNSVVDGYTLSHDKPTLIVSYFTNNAWMRVFSGVTLDWSYKTFPLETTAETNSTRCSFTLSLLLRLSLQQRTIFS